MASPTAPPAALTAPAPTRQQSPPTHARWDSLDVLRGVALCFMVAHHFAKWTGDRVGERFLGFPGFVVTDLAAPMFAVGVGAAAFLVGQHVTAGPSVAWSRLRRAYVRFGQILLLGIVIDVAVGGGVDGGGVLPTLALLGFAVLALSVLGVTSPTTWWGIVTACALAAVPSTRFDWTGFLGELWSGSFSVVVYGVFAAAGAAVAASAHPAGERALPLFRAAVAVLVIGLLAVRTVPQWVAPSGVWPPDRHPGELAFTLWGLAATLIAWAALRSLVTTRGWVGRGLARAGQRTLLVFGLHYLVKLALQEADLLGQLDTRAWGLVAWGATALVCAGSMLPMSRRSG